MSVEREMDPMDEAAALLREGSQDAIAKVCADRNSAERRISEAMHIASGRWEEWGSRAVRVANALDGGERDVDE